MSARFLRVFLPLNYKINTDFFLFTEYFIELILMTCSTNDRCAVNGSTDALNMLGYVGHLSLVTLDSGPMARNFSAFRISKFEHLEIVAAKYQHFGP